MRTQSTEKKRRIKKLNRVTPSLVLTYILVIALMLFSLLPIIYTFSTAFKPVNEILLFPPRFFVKKPTLQNFASLLTALSSSTVPFTRYIFNSIVSTAGTTLISVIICVMGTYGLVVHKPKGGKIITNLVISALMFSPYILQIPNYLVVVKSGLYNNFWALILPNVAVAYNFFLLQNFMGQIPLPLIEAARLDGAGEIKICARIVSPMLRPAIATLVVLTFVRSWNDSFSPLVFISSQAKKTLPLAMTTISGGLAIADLGRAGATMAAAFLTTLPPIIVFLCMQKQVMQTMAHSGIK